MFKTIDRYIIRKFLGTYVFAIILLLAIVVMFDINEKLDAFLKAPLHATIVDYFLNFIPYFANQFAPLFTFIAVIFFTSKLAMHNEIVAMLSSGMSFRRLLRPYMVSAAVIAAASFVLSAYIIPPANVKRINYTNTYVKTSAWTMVQISCLWWRPTKLHISTGMTILPKPAFASRSKASIKTNVSSLDLQPQAYVGTRCTTGA